MGCQGDEILRAGPLVKLDERVGVPSLSLPQRAYVLVSELRWMPVFFDVILVLRRTLDVHIPRVPVALFWDTLGTPMCPDPELGIPKPIRALIGLQRQIGRASCRERV